jgi:hypothetical protein
MMFPLRARGIMCSSERGSSAEAKVPQYIQQPTGGYLIVGTPPLAAPTIIGHLDGGAYV